MSAPLGSPAASLLGPVAGAMGPAPPLLPPETPLVEAVAALAAARASALLATDGTGRPIGILTEQDVTRRVAFRAPADAPLAGAMTSPIITCTSTEGLWRAIALMRAHHLRHLPVLDAEGRCVGMLHRADTIASASGRMLQHLDALGASEDAAVHSAQAGVAAALLSEGLPAPDVVGLVSEINLDLHRRVLARCVAAQPTPPPVGFTLLVMGSAGRGESLLRPDQDNGLVLDPYPDDAHGPVDGWFRGMTEALNEELAHIGFPLCQGGVMARNPLWRKRLSEWEAQFAIWARTRCGAALLFADIAFDFRAIAAVSAQGRLAPGGSGDDAPGQVLRRSLLRSVAAAPALLASLAGTDSALRVGLTLLGGFSDDDPGPDHRTDLKLHGLMPMVAAARLSALQHGIAATGTLARLAGLEAKGVVDPGESERLRAAFVHLLGLLLSQQIADLSAGKTPGSLVETGRLSKTDRLRLREALRAVRGFASTSFAGLTGRLW